MRKRLIIILILLLSEGVYAMGGQQLLYSARSEQDILLWAKQNDNMINKIEHINVDGMKLLAVCIDEASGTTRLTIYLYLLDHQEWKLMFVRFTNSSNIKIEYEKRTKQLLMKSKSGKLLLIQPIDSIKWQYDPVEQ